MWQYFKRKYASLVFVDFASSFVNKCEVGRTTHVFKFKFKSPTAAAATRDIFSETDTASQPCRLCHLKMLIHLSFEKVFVGVCALNCILATACSCVSGSE